MPHIDANGQRLFYIDSHDDGGDKPVLPFSHGLTDTMAENTALRILGEGYEHSDCWKAIWPKARDRPFTKRKPSMHAPKRRY